MKRALLAAAAFAAMEPVSYAAHRWVMHGAGWVLHESHHRLAGARHALEANDWFPVLFAGATMTALAVGASRPRARSLTPVGAGVTAYGAAYAFVHDGYTHQRAGRLPTMAGLEWLRVAHELHHRYGGEPYGMLVPVVPRAVRARAAADHPAEAA